MTYCYFGHHKCASAWFCGVIPAVCQDLGLSWHTTSSFDDFDFGSPAGRANFLLFRNAGINHVPPDRDFRGFHVIRDPRDVVVSAYHSHRASHPATDEWRELNEIRERLNGMTLEAGLLWELEFLAPVFRQMRTWNYSSPRIREFRMEELIANPFKLALESFEFLGLLDDEPAGGLRRLTFAALSLLNKPTRPWGAAGRRGLVPFAKITAERLLGIVHAHDFKRLSDGRRQGEEDVTSHYRKGIAGDWQRAFTPRVKERFKELYGPLLDQLGYAARSDW